MSGGSNLPLAGTPEQQLADPLHLFPNADNAGQPQTPGIPVVLSTLGGKSGVPIQPYGKFMAPNISGGGFNAMAARGAGPLFNPGAGAPSWQALMAQAIKNQPQAAPSSGYTPTSLNDINNEIPGIGGGKGKDLIGLLSGLGGFPI